MVNKVFLIGRIANDLVLHTVKQNMNLVRFSIATTTYFSGESKTNFINCVAFNRLADNLVKYMRKGSLIYLEGRLSTSSYENKEGKKIYDMNVVASDIRFLEKANTNNKSYSKNNEKTLNSDDEDLFANNLNKEIKKNESEEKITFSDDINWGEE